MVELPQGASRNSDGLCFQVSLELSDEMIIQAHLSDDSLKNLAINDFLKTPYLAVSQTHYISG